MGLFMTVSGPKSIKNCAELAKAQCHMSEKCLFSLTLSGSPHPSSCAALPDRQRRVHPLQGDGGRVPPQSGVLPAGQRRLHFGRRPDPGRGAWVELVAAAQAGQEGALQQRARGVWWVLWRFWAFVWGGGHRGGGRCAAERVAVSAAAPRSQLTPSKSGAKYSRRRYCSQNEIRNTESCSPCLSVHFSKQEYDSIKVLFTMKYEPNSNQGRMKFSPRRSETNRSRSSISCQGRWSETDESLCSFLL